jgi:hypothetical protein
MEERIERIGRIRTDFFLVLLKIRALGPQKSVCIRPIRSIRFPIVSQKQCFRRDSQYVSNQDFWILFSILQKSPQK